MSALVDVAIEWAAARGPPNWMFVLALLTTPSRWSRTIVSVVRARLQEDVDDGQ